MKRRNIILLTVAAAAALTTGVAFAQTGAWPSKPVKLVVPFPAGTSRLLKAGRAFTSASCG